MLDRLLNPESCRQLGEIRAVLFDLDGTLLRLSMERFVPSYIEGLARHFADLVEPARFVESARQGVRTLLERTDSEQTNEERFLGVIQEGTGVPPAVYRRRLERYYVDGLADLAELVRPAPLSAELVRACQQRGLALALATNPVFPQPLIAARLRWAGLGELAFHHVTSYENSCYCKPDPRYFRAVAAQLEVPPERCLMVGNDTGYDLAAADAGMLTYLLDTYLEDRSGSRWRADFRGDHARLLQLLERFRPPPSN